MDTTELRRIKRILRHTKSKLLALSHSISCAPSSLIASQGNLFEADVSGLVPVTRGVRVTYGSRSQVGRMGNSNQSSTSRSSSVYWSELGKPVLDSCRAINDHFRHDILGKLVQPTQDLDLTGSNSTQVPSLMMLAAFAVGQNYPTKYLKLDSEDAVDLEEDWYELVPFQFRRWVLLQHVTALHADNVNIAFVYNELIGSCIQARAFFQGYELLKKFWLVCGTKRMYELTWVWGYAEQLHKSQYWIDFVCQHLSPRDFYQSDLLAFTKTLEYAHDRNRLLNSMTKLLVDEKQPIPADPVSEQKIEDLVTFVMSEWLQCEYLPGNIRAILASTLELLCSNLDRLIVVYNLKRDLAVRCIIRCFELDVPKEVRGLWCSHFSEYSEELDFENCEDFSDEAIYMAALELKDFEYFQAAMKLILVLMTRISQRRCNYVTLEECESLLQDLQKLNKGKTNSVESRWHYEPMLDQWILSTPGKPSRSQSSDIKALASSTPQPLRGAPVSFIPKSTPIHTPISLAQKNQLFSASSPDPLNFGSLSTGMFKEPFKVQKKRTVVQSFHDGLSSDDEFGGGNQENVEPVHNSNNTGAGLGTILVVDDGDEEEDPLLIPSPQKKKARTTVSPVKPKSFVLGSPLPRTRDEDDLIF